MLNFLFGCYGTKNSKKLSRREGSGRYFSYNDNRTFVVLADFGEGVKRTISRVKEVADDLEALQKTEDNL